MIENTIQALQIEEIKKEVSQFAMSEIGKQKIQKLLPSIHKRQIEGWLEEVTEAKAVLAKSSSVPLTSIQGIIQALKHLKKGLHLRPDQLTEIYHLIDCAEKLKKFMKDKEFIAPRISSYVHSVYDLSELAAEINRCIRNGQVDDYASKDLLKIRKQIDFQEQKVKEKIEHVVKSSKYSKYLQDTVVSIRNGRYCISVKREFRKQMNGTILDTSASGSTVYMEPSEVGIIQDEVTSLRYEEEAELQKILYQLTDLVEKHEHEIKIAVDTLVQYDVIFAKAKFSQKIDGRAVIINEHHVIKLIEARHPLLGNHAVPLTIDMGIKYDALVITGPNTGGKTVTIKTVGLLTFMAQIGLHLPVKEGSEIAIFHKILVDIGDGQSIEQSLSTFSSRIKNVIDILGEATPQTLVLLDELGSGTDPAEGMGLATAILEELYHKGVTLLATTHYSEIKEYAATKDGFQNASMEFDIQSLKPTYRLLVGKGGDSQAFAIALKLGMHPKIIERAHHITYKEEKDYVSLTEGSLKTMERQLGTNNKHIRNQKHFMKEEQSKKLKHYFNVGDNVKIPYLNEYGIIFKPEDPAGNVIVIVKGEKKLINQKRLELYIRSEELYPEQYDMDIVFESKDNRKKEKQLKKHYVEGLTIEREE
ncbi:endonuclease MutS2 [Bacillus suaedaesalsae]|uniref:Endonuclease MutS2 n=1 Tax=Bacillus suaedaesalsae TaxID=2810349 RepID=A0ABS2DLU1_9BACI|nr:endonuclease MutS2 [Bacillus suaedaesalsae]MBM6619462.1 endonuclease MutS2 [Bacillus suaedaesalsae]